MLIYNILAKAIQKNDIKTVKQLIKQEVDINYLNDLSPLGLAAGLGNLEIVKLLLSNGADVNLQDEEGDTALMKAVLGEHFEVVKTLVEVGADVNIKACYGEYALSMAAHNGYEEIFDYLEPLTIPKWEPGAKVLAEAQRRKKIRRVKGV